MADAVNETNSIDLTGDDIDFIIDTIQEMRDWYPERIQMLMDKLNSLNPLEIKEVNFKQINVIGSE
jgi:hypothetical protein